MHLSARSAATQALIPLPIQSGCGAVFDDPEFGGSDRSDNGGEDDDEGNGLQLGYPGLAQYFLDEDNEEEEQSEMEGFIVGSDEGEESESVRARRYRRSAFIGQS